MSKIPYGSLAHMFVSPWVARETGTPWLLEPLTLLVPAGTNPEDALSSRGFFPWGERIFERYRKEIEEVYARAKTALFLTASPYRLTLSPTEVLGAEIDWKRAFPDDLDDPFAPSLAPTVGALPERIAPPPAEVRVTDAITVRPLVDPPRYIRATHPRNTGALRAASEAVRRIAPHLTGSALVRAFTAYDLGDELPLETLLGYTPYNEKLARAHDVLERRWADIQAHVARGETIVAVLDADLDKGDFVAAAPHPAMIDRIIVQDLLLLAGVMYKTPAPFTQGLDDLIMRGELDPNELRFAMLLRKGAPWLAEKIAYIEARYPDSPLLPELRKLARKPKAAINRPAILLDHGPQRAFTYARMHYPPTGAEDWPEDFYEPTPRA